jgi:hypothetical protein
VFVDAADVQLGWVAHTRALRDDVRLKTPQQLQAEQWIVLFQDLQEGRILLGFRQATDPDLEILLQGDVGFQIATFDCRPLDQIQIDPHEVRETLETC